MTIDDLGGSVGARPRERFLALDSLRGICALFLVLFHFHTIGAIHTSALVQNSYMFVDFFFVLSGFVIAASYGTRLAEGFAVSRFMLLRLGRIYPLHAAMLFLFLAVQLAGIAVAPSLATRAFFQGENGLAELVFGLLFIQIFVGTEETWYNPPSWSISAEMWAYLVAGVLFRLAGRRIAPAAAMLSAVAFAAYVLTLRHGIDAHHWGALPRCLFSFGLGTCAFRAFVALRGKVGDAPSRGWATVTECGVLLIALYLETRNYSVAGPFSFATLVLAFAFQAGWVSRLLVIRPMLLLGTLSYSIYMVHDFVEARLVNVLALAGRRFGRPDLIVLHDHTPVVGISPVFADAVTLLVLPIVIAMAWCTYRLIEVPGQRWSRRLVLGTRGARTIAAEERAPTF